MSLNPICLSVIASLAATIAAATAQAQSVKEFYQGRELTVYVGFSAGGGFDSYGRLVAAHLGKHIPGSPTVIVKNMPGAGSMRLANYLYGAAAKDGASIGILSPGAPFAPLFNVAGAGFDPLKLNWIGSANEEVSVCAIRSEAGIKDWKVLREKSVTVGGSGPTADTVQFPKVINEVLGTKMKIVTGYPGGNDVNLAMERGEVDGRCGWAWSSVQSTRPDWLQKQKINILFQMALSKHQDLPDVPLITDLAETEEQRNMLEIVFARQTVGRPFVASPAIPEERVTALRAGFMATMADKEFLAAAEKAALEITPVSGAEVQKLIQRIYGMPEQIVGRVRKILE